MPITIMAIALATPPTALPTALVSRPTEPSSSVPMLLGLPCGNSPSDSANSIRRLNCAVTTTRSASNWAAMVVPANQTTQPMKPKPSSRTSNSRQPRGIGRVRPSRRTPPSRNTAKIAPPTISSSGWARKMTPTMASAMPSQTARLGHLAADERIAKFRRAGPLDVRLDGRRRCCAISCSGATARHGRREAPRTRSAASTRRSSRRARR